MREIKDNPIDVRATGRLNKLYVELLGGDQPPARRGTAAVGDQREELPGIEIRDFAAEIARLSLVISRFQCDVLHRGPLVARAEFLPLRDDNWIVCGNALRLDWLKVCPPEGTGVKLQSDDLFGTPLEQPEIDFENEGGETFICGNPPYLGSKLQSVNQKSDLAFAWLKHPQIAANNDFVSGWLARFFDYRNDVPDASAAFVTTNSICQGQSASSLWPVAYLNGVEIRFAQMAFKWNNLAARNAGVTVIILGLGGLSATPKRLYDGDQVRSCHSIGPYLTPDSTEIVEKQTSPIGGQSPMLFGNMPRDGGHFFLDGVAVNQLKCDETAVPFVKRFVGSNELINGRQRYCLWIEDRDVGRSKQNKLINRQLELVADVRRISTAVSTRDFARRSHRFVQIAGKASYSSIVIPRHSSENREHLPVDLLHAGYIVGDSNFALYDAPLWNMALIASRLHLVWIATVCGKLKTDFRYSNTLGWNTFPVPPLTEQNKAELTRCAEEILLAREAHFPATIADLYDPEAMPANLRAAHEANDDTLERIYIGRRFRNDTERLETLFAMYAKMTEKQGTGPREPGTGKARRRAGAATREAQA